MSFTDLQEATMSKFTIWLVVLVGFLFRFDVSSFAAPPVASGTATFLGTDTNTQGNWIGVYGTIGYYIPSGPSSTPSDGSTFNPGAASLWTWGTNVASASALKRSGGNIASCWYKNFGTSLASLSFDIVVPSGQSQTVALYLLDYDKQGRVESVSVTDASNNPLSGPTVVSGTNFANGEYLIWTITGEVHVNITLVNGPNAVASGIFFGANTPPVSSGAYFNYSSAAVTVSTGGTTMTPIATLTLPAGTYLLHARVQVNNVLGTPSYETGECEFSQVSAESIPSLLHLWSSPAGSISEVTLDAPYSSSTTSVISVGCVYIGGSAQSIFGGTISALVVPSINTTHQ